MSVAVIRQLLLGFPGLIALCPPERIAAGDVPQGAALPAISIKHISTMSAARQDARASFDLVTSRVQVMVLARDYGAVEDLLRKVSKACCYQRGLLAGLDVASVVKDLIGPDMENGDASLRSKSVDFKVTYNEPN